MMGFDPFRVLSPVAKELAGHALWYAWGRIDAGVSATAGASLDMGNAFAEWYGDLAEAHESERSQYRPSILSEWVRFSTAGRIPAEVFVSFTVEHLGPSRHDWRDHVDCVGFDPRSSEEHWHCYAHEIYNQV